MKRKQDDELQKKSAQLQTLSPMEKEVFTLLSKGLKMKDVAKVTCRSYATINTHTTSIYRKLGVNSRIEMIVKFSGIEI